jgi:signal transduction histidine kinase
MANVPASSRNLQQSLLWSVAAVVCFNGVIVNNRIQVRWNAALRGAFGLSRKQWLRGGPLSNARIDSVDRQKIALACNALINTHTPVDIRFHVYVGGNRKSFRIVMHQVHDSKSVIGLLQDCGVVTNDMVPAISYSRWQSVGRLTLLDEVASAMAHELNQPLAAIATFSQAGERLLNQPEPRLEKAKQVFQEISQQALRAGDLIRNMRGLIKRQAPSTTRIRVGELIERFAITAQPMARTHHVEFLISTEIPSAYIEVDVTQITQVLAILFQNSLDALEQEGAKGKVIELAVGATNSAVSLSILDTGIGITADTAAQLFKPFFSTKDNGTGLGLISARNILETYGSRLEFANLPEGGCRFSFTLPTIPSL